MWSFAAFKELLFTLWVGGNIKNCIKSVFVCLLTLNWIESVFENDLLCIAKQFVIQGITKFVDLLDEIAGSQGLEGERFDGECAEQYDQELHRRLIIIIG